MKIHRPIDIGNIHYKKRGNPKVYQGTLYLEAGKDLNCLWQDFLIQPFVGLELDFAQLDRFSEHNRDSFLSIGIGQKSKGSAFSRLGLHLTAPCLRLAKLLSGCRLAMSTDSLQ